MTKQRKKYTADFKLKAVIKILKNDKTASQLAGHLDQNNNNGLMLKLLFEVLNNSQTGGIRSLLEGILNALMNILQRY